MSPREKPRASGGTCSPGHGGRTSPGAAVRPGLCQDTAHQSPHLKGAKSFSIQWASPCPPTHVSHDTALCLWRTAPTPETHAHGGTASKGGPARKCTRDGQGDSRAASAHGWRTVCERAGEEGSLPTETRNSGRALGGLSRACRGSLNLQAPRPQPHSLSAHTLGLDSRRPRTQSWH